MYYCINCNNCRYLFGGKNITDYELYPHHHTNIQFYVTYDEVCSLIKKYRIPHVEGLKYSALVCNEDAVREILMKGCPESLFPKEIIESLKRSRVKSVTK
jgi:hypothetical protein